MSSAFEYPLPLDASASMAGERVRMTFATVYEEWFRVVHHWCRSLAGPGADVEDLVQEIFIVVDRKLPTVDAEQLGAWLYGVTRRTVSDHRRRSWFRRIVLRRDPLDADELVDGAMGSVALLEQKQAQQRFYRIVDRMNAKWRETFVLYEVAGHSGEEIASLTGLPHATVRTHLHRARKQFLALLTEEQG